MAVIKNNLSDREILVTCPSCKTMQPAKEVESFGNCAGCELEGII